MDTIFKPSDGYWETPMQDAPQRRQTMRLEPRKRKRLSVPVVVLSASLAAAFLADGLMAYALHKFSIKIAVNEALQQASYADGFARGEHCVVSNFVGHFSKECP